jgi:hypothetical protein
MWCCHSTADIPERRGLSNPNNLQLLNIAFALHEIICDGAGTWFRWLDAGGTTSISAIGRR